MKKLLLLSLAVLLLMCLVACDLRNEHTHKFGEWSVTKNATCTEDGVKTRYCDCGQRQTDVIPATGENNNESVADVITVEDGYLVVNGEKTEHKVHTEPAISVIDGYIAINGKKTEYEVNEAVVITVEDGYIVANGEKTEYKVYTEPVISVIDGYVAVNGVKTEYKVSECEHDWETVTTDPTCTAGGYDTMTCKLCDKSVITNETAKLEHEFSESYSFDQNYHWFACIGCNETNGKEIHTADADDNCTVCGIPLVATPGVVYDVSADGTYAEVIGYEGDATKVKIASEYQGVPVKTIYDGSFEKTRITSIIIPDSVTDIGEGVFRDCSSLTSIIIPDNVTSIGNSAFKNCTNLTSVTIPDNVTSIGYYVFYGCSSLISVIIPDNVTSIGNSAFFLCTALASVTIGNSVTAIDSDAFSCCVSLTSIVIPDSVTSIGFRAFGGCSLLADVVIGDSVTSIDDCAFSNCKSLTSINIPMSVTYIGYDAFDDCHSSLYTEYEFGKYVASGNNLYAVLIEITNKNMSSYVIHEDTMCIGYAAFEKCSRLGSITIPDSVIGIGKFAFYGCTNLKSVVIPDGVKDIAHGAFIHCTSLNSVEIGGGVKNIGYGVFMGCTSLTYIKFNKTIEQWYAIDKGDKWNDDVPATEVICSDGKVKL